ncbi:cycloinulo-oligosaccharide fructanotransferase, partial [bacterium]|nr:cycloinulo-oligosaccharide fructanotransferase [bacterium]
KVFVIRPSLHADQPGESAERLSLSYPCATEHNGRLYVGYSNNGGRHANLNSAEMAIITVEQLSAE